MTNAIEGPKGGGLYRRTRDVSELEANWNLSLDCSYLGWGKV